MKLTKPVKIRQETADGFLAYFIELRRFIPVNKIGADIIDRFFNENKTAEQIYKKNKLASKKQVVDFLKQVKTELMLPFSGGYPLLKDDLFDVPIAVELNILEQCNLRCKHCSLPNYDEIMSFERIKEILSILNENKVFELNITGGEVFLHPDILKIIDLACGKYNFATSIVTNATLLTDDILRRIKKYNNLLGFLVSLEGVGEDNDKIRGAGVFKKVNQSIKKLKKFNFHVEISCTINAQNIDKYNKLIDYAKFLNVPINFNLFKVAKKEQRDLVLEPKKYFSFIDDIFLKREKYYSKIGLTNAAISGYLTTHKKRKTCRATLSGLTIDVNGRMVTCPFLSMAGYYKPEQLPKFNKNFVKIWQKNAAFNKFRKENLAECIACAFLFTGSVKNQDPYSLRSYLKYCKKRKHLGGSD